MSDLIYYRKLRGYRFSTTRDLTFMLDWPAGENWTDGPLGIALPEGICIGKWVGLESGHLDIAAGYAWDGASGPAVNTKNWLRASLVHDALYQLMRSEQLDHSRYRLVVDQIMLEMLLEDHMWGPRARAAFWAVRRFGGKHARPHEVEGDIELTAP